MLKIIFMSIVLDKLEVKLLLMFGQKCGADLEGRAGFSLEDLSFEEDYPDYSVDTQRCCHIKVCRRHFCLFLYLQHLCTLQNCVPHLQCFSDDLCCVLHHVRGGGYPLRLHQEL